LVIGGTGRPATAAGSEAARGTEGQQDHPDHEEQEDERFHEDEKEEGHGRLCLVEPASGLGLAGWLTVSPTLGTMTEGRLAGREGAVVTADRRRDTPHEENITTSGSYLYSSCLRVRTLARQRRLPGNR
jgi:hypothetical protein